MGLTIEKFASWTQLGKHPDNKIAKGWNISGRNEFVCLFQGYGETEGVDIFDWIFKDDISPGQKITNPRYTVNV